MNRPDAVDYDVDTSRGKGIGLMRKTELSVAPQGSPQCQGRWLRRRRQSHRLPFDLDRGRERLPLEPDDFGELAIVDRPVLPDPVHEPLAEVKDAVARMALGVDPDALGEADEVVAVRIDRRLATVEHRFGLAPVLLLLDPPTKPFCSCCVHQLSFRPVMPLLSHRPAQNTA